LLPRRQRATLDGYRCRWKSRRRLTPANGLGFGIERIINQKSVKWNGRRRVAKRVLAHIRAYNTAMQHSKLVVVQSYGSRAEADLAKGALEDAGIQAMVRADTAGAMREHLAWSGAGFKILVREEEATAARDVLTPPSEGDLGADFQPDRDPLTP